MHGMMLWWTYSSSEPAWTGWHPHHESATDLLLLHRGMSVHFEVSLSVLMILRRTYPRKMLHNSLPSGPIPFNFSGMFFDKSSFYSDELNYNAGLTLKNDFWPKFAPPETPFSKTEKDSFCNFIRPNTWFVLFVFLSLHGFVSFCKENWRRRIGRHITLDPAKAVSNLPPKVWPGASQAGNEPKVWYALQLREIRCHRGSALKWTSDFDLSPALKEENDSENFSFCFWHA